MAHRVNANIRADRTGVAEWRVFVNGVDVSGALGSAAAAERMAYGLVSNTAVSGRGLATKTAVGEVQIVTLTGFDGTDSFCLKDPSTGNETIPFVRGTNAAATDLQAALRTFTGDASLTVSGTTDEGPFTITWVDETTRQIPFTQGTVSGCTLVVAVSVEGGVG